MIAGIFSRKKNKKISTYNSQLFDILDQFQNAEFKGSWNNDNIVVANCLYANTPQSKNTEVPYTHRQTGCIIVAWARLDYRTTLIEKLNATKTGLIHRADNELIMAAYLRWGEYCCQHLYGDYCFAIYDPRSQSITCGRDHMGAKPFYYYLDDDIFAYSSSIATFHQLPCISIQPDTSWIAHNLISNSMNFEKTAYKNIFKLKPAHCMVVDQRTANQKSYFQFDLYKTIPIKTIEDAVDAYRERLTLSIKSRTTTPYPLACELSGGIDSSAITAIAAHEYPHHFKQFYTFCQANYEHEPEYIIRLCQRYSLPNNFISCKSNISIEPKLMRQATKALGSPFEHSVSYTHMRDFIKQKNLNVRTLLSGFGGDEFVTNNNSNTATAQLLHEKKYNYIYNSITGNTLKRSLKILQIPYKHLHNQPTYNPKILNLRQNRLQQFVLSEQVIKEYELESAYFKIAKYKQLISPLATHIAISNPYRH